MPDLIARWGPDDEVGGGGGSDGGDCNARGGPAVGSWTALVAGPVVAGAVFGVVAGVVWEVIAPVVRLPRTTGGLELDETSGARLFAFDGWFAVVAVVGGLIFGGAAVALVRRQGWRAVPAVAVGSVVAALLEWGVGDRLRRGGNAATAPVGSQVAVPLTLSGHALLALWPLAAVIVLAVISLVAPRLFDDPGHPSPPADVRRPSATP